MQLFVEQLLLFFVSIIANTASAMAGGGSGLLQFPALIFLGLPFGVALTTHKIATVALGLGASVRNNREPQLLHKKLILLMLVAGLPGVVAGAAVILSIPDQIAQIALGLLTMALGIYSLFKRNLGQEYLPKNQNTFGLSISFLVLFLLGFINGSLSSGTGLFVTLWMITWFGLDFTRATAHTMLIVGLFWNGAGAITLSMLSAVKWAWLPALIAGSVLGGYLGAHLGLTFGNPLIKRVFECITILVGLALIIKGV